MMPYGGKGDRISIGRGHLCPHPLLNSALSQEIPLSSDANDSSGKDQHRVLLIKDSMEDAHLIMALLGKEGRYEVTLAQEGIGGAELAEKGGWDIILTDLNLPGKDGLEIIQLSKATHPNVPIIATTGYTAPHYLNAAYRRGVDAVLNKPIDRDDLLQLMVDLMGRSGRTRCRTRPRSGSADHRSRPRDSRGASRSSAPAG